MASEKTKLEIVMAAVTTLAGSELVRALFKRAVETATDRIKKEVLHDVPDCREEIIRDIQEMPRHETENFWRRYSEARANLQDNRVAKLIGKIQPDPNEGRKPTIRWLNSLDDERFWLAFAFMEDNHFMEWLARVRINGGRIAQKDIEAIERTWQKTRSTVAEKSGDLWSGLKRLDNVFGEWLEKHGGAK